MLAAFDTTLDYARLCRAAHWIARDKPFIAMVGDRIYTDIAMTRAAGCVGVLVLSGEATEDDAHRMNPAPDFILRDIGELGVLLTERPPRPS